MVMLAGCTSSNPRSCVDGTCGDPTFPFCDVNGTLGGVAGECIAVQCEARGFAECRGDVEVRCNAAGDGYDEVRCELGCDAVDGCRLCEPDQTACTNGAVAVCDASGAVTSTESCPLGCFASEPRCREVAPSNDVATYLDMVPVAPPLDLAAGATINATTGAIVKTGGGAVEVPTFMVAAPPGGSPLRVFVADEVTLGDIQVISGETYGGPSVIVLARGEIHVAGALSVSSGDLVTIGCAGGTGTRRTNSPFDRASGSGGGAHATDGGRGGAITSTDPDLNGGLGGVALGTDELIPLRGGCAAGGTFYEGVQPLVPHGARGGGAVQLTSRRRITVDGTIDVNGVGGGSTDGFSRSGGGAGGGVLLEAPVVVLTAGAVLARGGDGSGCLMPPLGSRCPEKGVGARVGIAATDGATPTGGGREETGGGGGGGLGRIRINTATGAYDASSAFVIDGALTTGTIATR